MQGTPGHMDVIRTMIILYYRMDCYPRLTVMFLFGFWSFFRLQSSGNSFYQILKQEDWEKAFRVFLPRPDQI